MQFNYLLLKYPGMTLNNTLRLFRRKKEAYIRRPGNRFIEADMKAERETFYYPVANLSFSALRKPHIKNKRWGFRLLVPFPRVKEVNGQIRELLEKRPALEFQISTYQL